jgi:hypothetical protein
MSSKLFACLVLLIALPATAQIDDILNRVGKKAPGSTASTAGSTLPTDKIAAGLKEALTISTANAVAATGKPDGFLKNDSIHIPLPDRLKTAARGMRMLGMGAQVDELETGMNRAAEQAAPKAKAIFLNALKKMTFDDARAILSGGNQTAATEFFKRACSEELTREFTPIVHDSMQSLGVIKQYNTMIKSAPGGASLAGNLDFDKYVVGKSLDGLFYMLGKEEQNIRVSPAAQTTSLLKQVFGKK